MEKSAPHRLKTMNDALQNILNTGLQIGQQAAQQALGGDKETKGEDKKAQEQSARVSPALLIGGGVLVVVLALILFRRR